MIKNPIIIFGAGASYDYVREELKDSRRRPPLAKDLFKTAHFEEIISKYPNVSALASYVISALERGDDVEQCLSAIYETAKKQNNFVRKKQIIELMYYLHDLFQEISKSYRHATNNYSDIICHINDKGCGGCFVTFNYDVLLDLEMGFDYKKNELESLNVYIEKPIKLIKLHGSCDWVNYLRAGDLSSFPGITQQDSIEYLRLVPDIIFDEAPGSPTLYRRKDYKYSSHGNTHHFYPALAIPLVGKDKFVCPKQHIEQLIIQIQNTNRILIIGWKAADEALLSLLCQNIKNPTHITVVNKEDDKLFEVTKKRLEVLKNNVAGVEIKIENIPMGFSNFMSSDKVIKFFND